VQFHREKRCGHLADKNVAQTDIGSVIAEDPNKILVVIRGQEKWEALDVVPMHVRNEEGKLNGR
jgi:hypothetical protein